MDIEERAGSEDWSGDGFGRFAACLAFLIWASPPLATLRPLWWVRRCCSMLSLRVKALLHSGQKASFFASVFLRVTRGMAGGGEVVAAIVLFCDGARVAVLLGAGVCRNGCGLGLGYLL